MNHTVVVLVGGVHRGVLEALAYARSLSPNHLIAVSVVSDEEEQETARASCGTEFAHRRTARDRLLARTGELTRPILRYIDELDARWENDVITVLLPEFVVPALVGQPAPQPDARCSSKGRLLFRKGTVVTSLPYHLGVKPAAELAGSVGRQIGLLSRPGP